MRKNLIILVLALWSLVVSGIGASSNISLDDALSLAQKNNLGLKTNAIDLNSAKRDVDTSWNLFVPSIDVTLANTGTNDVFKNKTALSNTPIAKIGMSLVLNPAVEQQIKSYDLGFQVQSVTLAQAEAELERNVTKLFYYLIMEEKNLGLQQANMELSKKQYDKVQDQFGQGFASDLELLNAQLSYERLRPAIQQEQNTFRKSMLSFKVLLGVPLDEEIKLDGTVPDLIKELEVQSLKDYLSRSFSLTLLDLNIENLKNTKILTSSQSFMPSVSLNASYTLGSLGFSNMDTTWYDSASYTFAVSIPLDDYIPNSRTKVSLAKLQDNIDKLQLSRMQAQQQLEMSVINQVQNLNMLSSQAELAQQSLDVTQKVLDMTTYQYENGYVAYLSVEEAQNNLLSAQQGLLGVQYQYISSLIDLIYDLNIQHEQTAKELLK